MAHVTRPCVWLTLQILCYCSTARRRPSSSAKSITRATRRASAQRSVARTVCVSPFDIPRCHHCNSIGQCSGCSFSSSSGRVLVDSSSSLHQQIGVNEGHISSSHFFFFCLQDQTHGWWHNHKHPSRSLASVARDDLIDANGAGGRDSAADKTQNKTAVVVVGN